MWSVSANKLWLVVVGVVVLLGAGGTTLFYRPRAAQQNYIAVDRYITQSEHDRETRINMPCDPPVDLRTSDLCAQWKAADAAQEGATWSMISGVATIATLAAVILGFIQSQQVQRLEFASYLKGIIKRVEWNGGGYKLDTHVVNYGRTPGIDLKGEYGLTIFRMPENTIDFHMGLPFAVEKIHPNEPIDITNGIGLGADELDFSVTRVYHAIYFLEFSYRDVFGKIHHESMQKLFSLSHFRGKPNFSALPSTAFSIATYPKPKSRVSH